MNRLLALLLVLFFISCDSSGSKNETNTAIQPVVASIKRTVFLPKELKEISGISFSRPNEVVAVQDETGLLFFYDLQKDTITRTYEFAKPGDYEDLVVDGTTVYIVTSSGTILQIDNLLKNPGPAKKYETALTEKNNIEGLALDKKHNRLLLAAKDAGLEDSDRKEIFEFDLKTKKLNESPVYSIRLSEIEGFYKGDELEEASKKFLKALGNNKLNGVFRTSAITFHPTTGELFALTSLNNLIAVMSPETGKIKRIIELKGPDYNQPEGLAFTDDGRLFVSNESNGRRANIIEITYD